MENHMNLSSLSDETLDSILASSPMDKQKYFSLLAERYYKHIEPETDEFYDLLEQYISSFNLEKLYRNNRFLNERFIVVYTSTGLIKNIISSSYYVGDNQTTH